LIKHYLDVNTITKIQGVHLFLAWNLETFIYSYIFLHTWKLL
jgi:hypothetical protein